MLLYFRVQNSGQPLQGTVFVGAAEELVELAVPLVAVDVAFEAMPPICVRLTERVETVICEFVELDELLLVPVTVAELELAVPLVTCPVTVAYSWPEPVGTYVYPDIVEYELVKDNSEKLSVLVALLVVVVVEEVLLDESCPVTPAAARHISHIAFGNILPIPALAPTMPKRMKKQNKETETEEAPNRLPSCPE